MHRVLAVLAVLSAALIISTPSLAVPVGPPNVLHLHVTGQHLGSGLVQYTLEVDNPPGGAIAVDIMALSLGGPFEHRDANVPIFSGGSGVLAPVDTFNLSQAAVFFDPVNYDNPLTANPGDQEDTWYDDTDLSTPTPPHNGAVGGTIGSAVFNFSAGSPAGSNILLTRIAQLVVLEPLAVSLPVGDITPLIVSIPTGIAQVDLVQQSRIASQGQNFIVDRTIALIPEPSTLTLLGMGMIGLFAYGWQRRRGA